MIKILDLRIMKLPSTLKAYVDIDYYGLIVKGMRVVEGKNGFFVSMPREKGKDEKWYDVCYPADMSVKQELENLILSKYYEMKKTKQEIPTEE